MSLSTIPISRQSQIYSVEPAVMFESVQQTSFLTVFFLLKINSFKACRAPASMTYQVCSSLPVTIFPMHLRHGTETATFGCYRSYTSLGKTPVPKIHGILSSPPSERQDIAQQTSTKISSTSFSMRTFDRDVIALSTLLNEGDGLPLQRLLSVQLAFLTKEEPGWALSRISAIGLIAPSCITISLIL